MSIVYVTGEARIAHVTLMPHTVGARTWAYGYDTSNGLSLASVLGPEGALWTFDFAAFDDMHLYKDPSPECGSLDDDPNPPQDWSGSITAPSGLTGTFTLSGRKHARADVPEDCLGLHDPNEPFDGRGTWAAQPNAWYAYTLMARSTSGAGVNATWSYAYSAAAPSWHSQCGAHCIDTVHTTVNRPDGGSVKLTYSSRYGITEGELQSRTTWSGADANGSVLRSEAFGYADPIHDSVAWPAPWGDELQYRVDIAKSQNLAPRTLRTIGQNGDTYTWQAEAFNEYAQVTRSKRSNDIAGEPSLEAQQDWYNDTAHWVLGQPKKTTNLNNTPTVTSDDTVVSEHTYATTTGLLTDRYAFGRKVMSYAWHDANDTAPGSLKSFTDGNGHTTQLSNYKRGIPQTITYADNTSKSLVVDDFGDIQSITDALNRTTSYGYDDLGRLTHITYPNGDPQAWAPVDISYQTVTTSEYGVSGSHLRVTRAQGRKSTKAIYNALLRPVLTVTRDTDGSGGDSGSMLWRDYDAQGRTTFSSYPLAYAATLPTNRPGVATEYDALGRVTKTKADSELGTLTTQTQYLAGNTVKVTDPKNHITTTNYQALNAPAYAKAIHVSFADGTETTIDRDVYGKPLTMAEQGTYNGSAISVSHGFVYDGSQRLCKQVSPETGQTGYGFDAAGNLKWTAQGLTGSASVCTPETSVPAAAKVSRSYDARNRLLVINYPSGTPDTALSYDDDGKLETASRNGAIWTLQWNHRGLLTDETLAIDSKSFHLGYGYDAEGARDTIHYPSGRTLTLAPDGLGRPTQAGVYASNIGYAPSGPVTNLTYGNDATMLRSLNTRDLIESTRYRVDGANLTERTLTYDKNGNLASISDAVQGTRPPADQIFADGFDGPAPLAGTDARSYAYDVLDRLINMASSRYGTEAYSYDPLGNVRSRTFGGNTFVFHYDAVHNRLSTVTNGPMVKGQGSSLVLPHASVSRVRMFRPCALSLRACYIT